MGLRVIEWVEFNIKTSAFHMVYGRNRFVFFSVNGRIYQWPLHSNGNACSTHTDSHFFALWKRYAASAVIKKHGLSLSFAAQKNSLQRLWPDSIWLVRQEASTSSRSLLWRHTNLSGDRDSTGAVSALRNSETRTTRLSVRQPALYQTVRLVCGQTVSQQHVVGHCPRTAFGLAHRQGPGQAIHDCTTGTCRNPGTQSDWLSRNLDPQRTHLSHRGQRPDPSTPHLVW